ncbi:MULTISPECIES: TetR/AcrR family transcriptional regulator [Geobacillus]|jgi:AcrR family transcriptional regulator|uniref:Transcriptional regulator (TetR/AcrR family) n=2 Tax=Geobacillus thermodenitrificans TaxID=33940 RepID=A4ILR7_GEOTN|nr:MULTISPECIES: TetR/AcrR family transcriptional regulator [Geobacillus]ABO66271.1 Transcriptional regulator (TetR/AcrR family) [Geobacillus thermodenitrificans NG80-2]ARA97331.1 TetR family transcriptional regulator [Geobacillus thermodenitrificans]ARP42027.1 HTH-type transcriptional repressor KstR2 [Geobacillus thermodenitrificans]ATO36627.1 TetR family transcriptional regulator [Geobacillus thermodenitrificans]KQB94032.1 TetR family transcriptional regulator [Geobacillus sp. PA-3]
MREKIIAASIELFEQNGFSETSIQDIVDALGVTKGTFYYYFKSKEELLMDIHLRYIEGLLSEQARIMNDEQRTMREKLYAIVYMLIHNVERQGRQARIFFREMKHLSEEHLQKVKEKRDLFRYHLQALIEEGMKTGELRRDLSPSIATLTVLGAANWSYHWFRPDGELTDAEVAKQMVTILIEGMSAPYTR